MQADILEVTTPLQKEFGMIHIRDLESMFNVKDRTLKEWWVRSKGFPKPVVVSGDCILYRRNDICKWIESMDNK